MMTLKYNKRNTTKNDASLKELLIKEVLTSEEDAWLLEYVNHKCSNESLYYILNRILGSNARYWWSKNYDAVMTQFKFRSTSEHRSIRSKMEVLSLKLIVENALNGHNLGLFALLGIVKSNFNPS